MRLSLCLILALIVAGPAAGRAQERTDVHLFQYGSANAPDAQAAFLDFLDLMGEKLPRLASELQLERDIREVGRLAVVPVLSDDGNRLARPSERVPSLDGRRRYWRETGALALLTGRVTRVDGDGLAIRSTFFWGELGGPDVGETIDLDLPFSSAAYDTTNDSHSVAVLYSLAMTFARDCDARADAFFLLSNAQLRAEAVAADAPALGGRLLAIVTGAAEELRQRCDGS